MFYIIHAARFYDLCLSVRTLQPVVLTAEEKIVQLNICGAFEIEIDKIKKVGAQEVILINILQRLINYKVNQPLVTLFLNH